MTFQKICDSRPLSKFLSLFDILWSKRKSSKRHSNSYLNCLGIVYFNLNFRLRVHLTRLALERFKQNNDKFILNFTKKEFLLHSKSSSVGIQTLDSNILGSKESCFDDRGTTFSVFNITRNAEK